MKTGVVCSTIVLLACSAWGQTSAVVPCEWTRLNNNGGGYVQVLAIDRSNPDTVLIVDAVAFGGYPGECRLLEATPVDTAAVSTHAGSLAMLCDYLSARTKASIRVLAIQPERIDAREGLSPQVEKSVLFLAAVLSEFLSSAKLETSRIVE